MNEFNRYNLTEADFKDHFWLLIGQSPDRRFYYQYDDVIDRWRYFMSLTDYLMLFHSQFEWIDTMEKSRNMILVKYITIWILRKFNHNGRHSMKVNSKTRNRRHYPNKDSWSNFHIFCYGSSSQGVDIISF